MAHFFAPKRDLQKRSTKYRKSTQIDPKSSQIDPKSSQNRPQIDPRTTQNRSKIASGGHFGFWPFLDRFFAQIGSDLGAIWAPILDPKSIKNRSKFSLVFWSVSGSIWARFGEAKWLPKRAQNDPKCVSKRFLVEKRDFSKTSIKPYGFWLFLPPRGSQNDQKCSPRGSKRPFFFMLIFDIDFGALWGRFGLIFGGILAPKIDQKIDPKNDQNFDAKKS